MTISQAFLKLLETMHGPISKGMGGYSEIFFVVNPETSQDTKMVTRGGLKIPVMVYEKIPEGLVVAQSYNGIAMGVSLKDPELKVFEIDEKYMENLVEIFNITQQ